MKFRSLFWSMTACTMLMGCSNDDGIDKDQHVGAEGVRTYVAKVNLRMGENAAGARALDGYQDGEAAEYGVTKAVVAFYAADKTYLNKATVEQEFQKEGTDNDLVTSKSTVTFTARERPVYAVALINPSAAVEGLLAEGKTVTDLTQARTEALTTEPKQFFMTNSTYVDGQNKVVKEVALGDNVVEVESVNELNSRAGADIYVERVAVKVTLEAALDPANKVGSEDVYRLKYTDGAMSSFGIKIVGWSLNGTNKSFYPLKHIASSYADFAPSWNSVADHRSHWAEDPNYAGTDKYPVSAVWESLTAFDPANYALNYIRLDDSQAYRALGTTQYCYENTYDNSQLPAAITHVVLKAQYMAIGADNTVTPVAAGEAVYRIGQVVWTKEKLQKDIAAYFLNHNYTIKEGETVIREANALATKIGFAAKGNTFKENDLAVITMNGLAVTDVTGKTVTDLTAAYTSADIVAYPGGYCSYTIPIRHFGVKDKLGYWGVVRNHWYQLKVTSIAGFGDVSSTEPVIPTPTPLKTWAVKCNIQILSWSKVTQEEITIGGGTEWD